MDTTAQNFETQARRMWTTRPVRLPRSQSPQAWFFGVCEGIAVRYQVSPVLVRLVVGLSVTLGGLGLWFYLVALLVMPRYGVPLSPVKVLLKNERDPRYARDREVGVRTLVVGVILLVLGGLGSGGVTLGGVVGGVVVTAVVWWLLHQRLPVPPAGLTTPVPDAAAPAPTTTYPGVDLGSLTPAAGFAPPRTTPPSWDPLGTAPFAWDLPEPPDPSEDAAAGASRPKRSLWRRLVRVALGVVVTLGVLTAALVAALSGGLLDGRSEDSATTQSRSFTSETVTVGDLAEDRTVRSLFSDIDVDLTGTEFPSDRTTARLSVDARFSGVDVVVPEKTDGPAYRIRVDCSGVRAADVDCDSLDGVLVPSTGTTQAGKDAATDADRTLTLELRATASEIRTAQRPSV